MRPVFTFIILMFFCATGISKQQENTANVIVRFLEGNWQTFSFSVADGQAVNTHEYRESMEIKNDSTLTITAYEYLEGQDITRDMVLIVDEGKITMRQGTFEAAGYREGNAWYLSGMHGDTEYRFRLYTMGDKYVFHREIRNNGKVDQVDMSYLLREK
ncbi:MAG: hypothetical protein R6U64_00510 [Bacteroidales bacterium]